MFPKLLITGTLIACLAHISFAQRRAWYTSNDWISSAPGENLDSSASVVSRSVPNPSQFTDVAPTPNAKPEAFLVQLKPKNGAYGAAEPKSKFLLLLRLPERNDELLTLQTQAQQQQPESAAAAAPARDSYAQQAAAQAAPIEQQRESAFDEAQQAYGAAQSNSPSLNQAQPLYPAAPARQAAAAAAAQAAPVEQQRVQFDDASAYSGAQNAAPVQQQREQAAPIQQQRVVFDEPRGFSQVQSGAQRSPVQQAPARDAYAQQAQNQAAPARDSYAQQAQNQVAPARDSYSQQAQNQVSPVEQQRVNFDDARGFKGAQRNSAAQQQQQSLYPATPVQQIRESLADSQRAPIEQQREAPVQQVREQVKDAAFEQQRDYFDDNQNAAAGGAARDSYAPTQQLREPLQQLRAPAQQQQQLQQQQAPVVQQQESFDASLRAGQQRDVYAPQPVVAPATYAGSLDAQPTPPPYPTKGNKRWGGYGNSHSNSPAGGYGSAVAKGGKPAPNYPAKIAQAREAHGKKSVCFTV